MNARICKIAQETDAWCDQRYLGEDSYNIEWETKFAELIIQECMRQVEEQYKPVLEDEAMMKDTHWDGYVHCGVDSYVSIREHFFGVDDD